jgi:hypothetical protein
MPAYTKEELSAQIREHFALREQIAVLTAEADAVEAASRLGQHDLGLVQQRHRIC